MSGEKTAIVTGAQQGIGAGLVEEFLRQDFSVVATSRNAGQSLTASTALVLVDGDIGKPETASKVVEASNQELRKYRCVGDQRRNFFHEAFHGLFHRGLQRLGRNEPVGIPLHHAAGCETNAEAKIREICQRHRVRLPISRFFGVNASVPMITKEAARIQSFRSLAIEYAKQGIRFNAVAPGVVDTPMHKDDPQDSP